MTDAVEILPGQLDFKGEDIYMQALSRTAGGKSRKSNWATPDWFCEMVQRRLGIRFTLDVMAEKWNAKCYQYIDLAMDAFKASWSGIAVWCNPPDVLHGAAVIRAIECGLRGDYGVCVMLVRCGLESEAWDIGNAHAALTEIIRPRLNYVDPETKEVKKGAAKHSTLFYFTPESVAAPRETNERVVKLVDYIEGSDVDEGCVVL